MGICVKMLLFFSGVFMTSVHSLKWTDVPVELGENTTLNCSLVEDFINWNMQLLGENPVKILKMFSKQTKDFKYYNATFNTTYSVKPGYHLVIHNVTVDDMRFYYCTALLNNAISEIFHLVSAGDPTHSTCPDRRCSPQKNVWSNSPLTLVSLSLNVLLITALAAGCCFAARRLNRSRPRGSSDLSPLTPDPAGDPAPAPALYEEIPAHIVQSQRSPHGGATAQLHPAPPGSECIYYKAQLPQAPGSGSAAVPGSAAGSTAGPGSGSECIYHKAQLPQAPCSVSAAGPGTAAGPGSAAGPVSAAGSVSAAGPGSAGSACIYSKAQLPVPTPPPPPQ